MKIGDKVTVIITQYDHERGSKPYQCELVGEITETDISTETGEEIYCVVGNAKLNIGYAPRWGWYADDRFVQPATGKQMHLIPEPWEVTS